jgi:glycosyltransferase involved in cell wall biosynthesis
MMACGLPVVDLRGFGTEAVHGREGPIELAEFDDLAVGAAIERLLDDPALRAKRARAGLDYAGRHSWDMTTQSVEEAMRQVLARREDELAADASV